MAIAAAPVQASRLPSPALRRFAWGVLAYFIAVILWGAVVRATGVRCGLRQTIGRSATAP